MNAAGVIKRQPSLEMPVEEFRRIVDVNLTGTFIVNQAAGRIMKNQSPDERGERGSIVNIASLNSYISLTEVLAYASSKSGVLGIIRGLANEWAQHGIRVNGIAPGRLPDRPEPQAHRRHPARRIPQSPHAAGPIRPGRRTRRRRHLPHEPRGELYERPYDHRRRRIYHARRRSLTEEALLS